MRPELPEPRSLARRLEQSEERRYGRPLAMTNRGNLVGSQSYHVENLMIKELKMLVMIMMVVDSTVC